MKITDLGYIKSGLRSAVGGGYKWLFFSSSAPTTTADEYVGCCTQPRTFFSPVLELTSNPPFLAMFFVQSLETLRWQPPEVLGDAVDVR